ncbi:MAG: hypothetical protein ACRD5M_01220 [Candidatus Acidiferrales bacterium]
MKKGPIGVWFSAALVILVLGIWAGTKLGAKFAQYRYRQQQEQRKLSGGEQAHAEIMLSELFAVQTLRLYAGVTQNDKELGERTLLNEIRGFESLQQRPDAQEIRPVIDLYLGLAYVDWAVTEEQRNNKDLATKYFDSAQTLFQSLGWQDCSEDTLKSVARHELDEWGVPPKTKEIGK